MVENVQDATVEVLRNIQASIAELRTKTEGSIAELRVEMNQRFSDLAIDARKDRRNINGLMALLQAASGDSTSGSGTWTIAFRFLRIARAELGSARLSAPATPAVR